MEIIDETEADGVARRRFDLTVEEQTVPGVHWRPAGGGAPTATILVGHGGFQDKEAPNIVGMAALFAREHGYATIALDAPRHGDRRTEEQIRQQEKVLANLRENGVDQEARAGRDRAVGADAASSDRPAPDRPPRMVREWVALLDELAADGADHGRFGYWGVSMGARYGIPLVAQEPRVEAAVLGLFGLIPDPAFTATVESISIPLLFLFQYHDELMTPESGIALFEAFGSREKTMHINPGPHVGIPTFERESSGTFFARHLG